MPQAAAEKRIARALSLAIQKPTIASGPAAPFLELHTVLRELFPLLFTQGDWETVEERALLGRVPGSGSAQPLLFLSHLDVFPIRSPGRWTAGPFSGTFSAPSNRSTKHVWRRIVMMSLKISYGKQNSRTAHTSRTAARQPRTISSVFKGGDLRMVAMV